LVEQEGNVLDSLVPSRRKGGEEVFQEAVQGGPYISRVVITAKLKNYGAATREMLPGVEHRQHRSLYNRAENAP
jgi:putative transposase